MCESLSCARLGAAHFPVMLMLLMVVTLALTYILAVYRQDVDPYFPYISDAASKRPESCVFGQLLNIGAFLGLVTVYLRYRLVKELNRGSDRALDRTNIAAAVLGFASAFSLTIVANFQVSAVFAIHLTGAFSSFGCGLIYCILQTVVSYRMYPLYNGITVCRLRLLISIFGLAMFINCLITGILSAVQHHKYHDQWYKNNDISTGTVREYLVVKQNEPGYYLHISSAVSEWLLAFSIMLFLLTYSRDFEKIRVTLAVEPLVTHLDESLPTRPVTESQALLSSTRSTP